MTSCDKRLEELLNRAGQTISDLPKRSENPNDVFPYPGEQRLIAIDTAREWLKLTRSELDLVDGEKAMSIYILHLTDVIDRMEWALKNLLNIYDRQTHIIANVDAPEGLTQEQYFKAVEAIIAALDKYRAGLEPWDNWGFEDAEEV